MPIPALLVLASTLWQQPDRTSEIYSLVARLCSPEFAGRMTLSEGNRKAADYIAAELRKAGLRPLHGRSYFHEFDITIGRKASKASTFKVNGRAARVGSDVAPFLGSAEGKQVTGRAVLVSGTPTLGPRDLAGAIAVARWSDGSLSARVAAFRAAGAEGVVFVGGAAPGATELPKPVRTQSVEAAQGIVAFGATSRWWQRICPMPWPEQNRVQETELNLDLVAEFESNTGKSRNVVAMLPGRDPALKGEYIVIGAHMDHLGFGETSSRTGAPLPHFGADDNASGTAGLIFLARRLAETKFNRRTIIFQAYSGEELGLVGAEAWCRENEEILKKTHLMVNMDMIGRLRDGKLTVFGLGTSPGLGPILDQVKTPGVEPGRQDQTPPNSDHAAFARKNVPVLFFNTGLHEEYHTEKDTLATLNIKGMAAVLDFIHQTVQGADAVTSKLVFGTSGLGTATPAGDPTRTRRVRVGFIPDMAGGGPGLMLNGATQDSPAAKAGIKAGDRLIQFGDKKIDSIEDLQAALVAAKAGVAVKVKIIRDGATIELELTPVEAPSTL